MAQNALNAIPTATDFTMYIHSLAVDHTIVNTSDTTQELDVFKAF